MNNLTIKTKLTLLVLFSVTALVIVGIVGNTGIRYTSSAVNEVTQIRLPSIMSLGIINEGKTAIRAINRRTLIYQNDYNAQSKFTDVINKKAEVWERIEGSWKLYMSIHKTGEETENWKAFIKSWNKWKQGETSIATIINALARNTNPETQKIFFVQLIQKMEAQIEPFSAVEALLAKIIETNHQAAETSKQNVDQAVKIAWTLMFVSSLVAILVTIALGVVIIRSITNPLAQSVGIAQRIARGDLTSQITLTGENEISHLLESLASMQNVIKGIIAAQSVAVQKYAESWSYEQVDASKFPGAFGNIAEIFNNMAHNIQLESTKLSKVLESLVDGLITIDTKGCVDSFNPAAERIFGYSAAEVLGRNVKMLMPEPYHSEHDSYLKHYQQTGEKKIIDIGGEVTGRRRDGSIFPMDLAVSPMTVNGQQIFIGIIRDITERKKIDIMKNEFISTVSHELRTPLTSIQGAVKLVLSGMMGDIPEESAALLKIANSNSNRLVRLINDILDIEKIESGNMVFELKPLEMMSIVKEALDYNQSYAQEYGVTLVLSQARPDCFVWADHDRLIQVMTNLISNAAKFSPKGAQVDIAVTGDNNTVRLSVTDYGLGIADEFKDRIFGKFSQADGSASRQKGGTGLGLSICKAIVEKLGGQISYDSVVDNKTSFYVDLPVWHTEVIVVPALSPLPSADNDLNRILICEDDSDVANLLRIMLEKKGHTADIALSAEQAKHLLNSHSYAAMTLNLMLPGQSDIGFFKELRQAEQTRNLPIIVVSAIAESGKKELNGEALCVYDWLDKPINQHRLENAIANALKKRGKTDCRILHVEDEPDIVQIVRTMLQNHATVDVAPDLLSAKTMLHQHYDLVILDLGLPDGSGASLFPTISQQVPPIPVVIFSGHDAEEALSPCVVANFVKSKTSNETLIKSIEFILNDQQEHC
jgi:PAS domain S-box-containing protein